MRRLFRVVFFGLAIAVSAAAPALAQGEAVIHGLVTTRADGSPLSGATLELQGTALAAPLRQTTTADGHFACPGLTAGDYALTITHANFREERYRVSLRPREVQNVEFALVLRPVEESVEVTARSLPSVFSPGS